MNTLTITLSVSEIIAISTFLVSLIGAVILAYTSLNVRVKAVEIRVSQNEVSVQTVERTLETIRKENREDHGKMFEKLESMAN